jgi:energy-coupling factor transporter ATP-binding protein EcfA2
MNEDRVLEARDVVKSFGSTPALRGASVSVGRGEILAVMGPSGSGKSTLLHCLAGILVPDRGQILFDGQRLDTMRENPRSALRFAAMRLAGATPRQVSVVAAVEAAAAAVTGTAAGFGLFFGFRSELAKIPFSGQPFFPADKSLSPVTAAVVALDIPVAAAAVAQVALRRVRISPLGTARRTRARRPSAWRTLPLLAGVGDLVYFTAVGHPATVNGQLWAYLGGGALTVTGLVIAGPWLTMAGSALLAQAQASARAARAPRAALTTVTVVATATGTR